MKNNIFLFAFCLAVYFLTADSEIVWLKDMNRRFQTYKRTLSEGDLPDQLSFRLKRKSHSLTLNLRKNHDIDPNADIYIVRNLDDERSVLERAQNLGKEDVAYYQDSDNGAFMTAKCVKRSRGQCDIAINGNIRIRGRNYDLRPIKEVVTSRTSLETADVLGKQYVLLDQSYIKRDMTVQSEDVTNDLENNMEEKLKELPQNVSHGQDEQVLRADIKLLFQNVAGIRNTFKTGGDMSGSNDKGGMILSHTYIKITTNKNDRIPNLKKEYYIKVLVVTDSSVYDLFKTTVHSSLDINKAEAYTHKIIRRYYSYIMNGVNHLYKGIDDPNIAIHVSIRAFVIFKLEAQFPHDKSRVYLVNGTKTMNGMHYLSDLGKWDGQKARKHVSGYDQVILFTRHELINHKKQTAGGLSVKGFICEAGRRVELVTSSDYFVTTSVAAHELGHSIGAAHDGEEDAIDCKAEDEFIMNPKVPLFNPNKMYSRNPWQFSKCTVRNFKTSLQTKVCVTRKPVYAVGELDEWNKFMTKLPGDYYTPSMQCHTIIGPGSKFCGVYRK